jgi:hypothetical protein
VAQGMSGMPPMRAIDWSTEVNTSVPIRTAGMPRFSISTLLSRPLELHEPQSPWVSRTASQSSSPFHSSARISRPAS